MALVTFDGKISSVRLANDVKITQKSAWFLLTRIKDATDGVLAQYLPVENFPLYRVGSDGSVWSRAKGRACHGTKRRGERSAA